MKKVGIITFHSAENSGAALQCIALCNAISLYGKDAEAFVIDYQPSYIKKQYKLFINPFLVLKSNGTIGEKTKSFLAYSFQDILFYKKLKRKLKFCKFRKERMILSKQYNSYEDLVNSPPIADIYIAGSDQIWNKDLTGGQYDPAYFLCFGNNNIRKYSYAISIGKNPEIVGDEILHINKDIDVISFREKSVYEYYKSLNNGINVTNSIDPTLLLNKNSWEKIIKRRIIKQKYILVYGLEKNDLFKSAVNNCINLDENIKIIDISQCNLYINKSKCIKGFSPDEFLNYIFYADYVITNSFHCTVFSTIFHKNFYVIPHTKSNNRISDLLENVGLSHRLYNTNNQLSIIKDDWNIVDCKIEKLRSDSINYLKHIIEFCE